VGKVQGLPTFVRLVKLAPLLKRAQVAGLPGDGLRVEIDAIAYKP